MKIELALLDEISLLAAINLTNSEKDALLTSLNSLIEDFSCLHDFCVEGDIKNKLAISLRPDFAVQSPFISCLHQNFPVTRGHLLVAPLINHEEK